MTKAVLTSISQLALKALLYEVSLSPKPGLVDRFDNGAHDDMSFMTFIDSMIALSPFFQAYIETGFAYAKEEPLLLFNRLRQLGQKAEETMFCATQGINTHKGLNFSMALLLGATGAYLARTPHLMTDLGRFSKEDTLAICRLVKPMTAHLIQTDLGHLNTKKEFTYGEQLFVIYGIKGPRGEASEGFTTLTDHALPYFRQMISQNDPETSQLRLLVYLMSIVEDGNLIHRGGIEAWKGVKADMRLLLQQDLSTTDLRLALSSYNQCLINQHLSPGGAADLLALTFYFAFLEKLL
ncbi:TPA: triphosphoribosyl-dephospho-CoA synthase CitG [Streptococcus pyogenes]|uniref:triphosphoribosyl-dephospho-CoA synthase CitG n=1 Tax=Streptococcus pyogenes TaxID=1314 RepID=UPI00109C017E|nr:triphosphoribosyl-dephospho-CoA synthase CitG [Streptococcus pyogenes]VHM83677.1 triphosphoribosyl-dephospho-CoA synthase CitG [Streptococcus pyogenes]HEQ9313984.1 triphosphoribosyl-dephospho-CoA synthase CitG [Streptococcus pyogenes]HER2288917.1 triphosphoribosyl-dephospho-CoA synthase CitG [Streptococcus pyogenes]HES3067375.1 triphosphoribosyl-dephospho-CoA synthase CitG [Streptococcus pyogenes]